MTQPDRSGETVPHAQFVRDGDGFAPTRYSLGYWVDDTLNGAAMASLLGFVLEERHGAAGFVPVRYGVDLLGMARAETIHVETQVIRAGGRLRLVEGRIVQGGALMARATLQLIRETEAPDNPTWQSPAWPAPLPVDLPAAPHRGPWEMRPVPAVHARQRRVAPPGADAARGNPPVLGPLDAVADRQTWLRIDRAVVDGVPHTPFTRLAVAGDFASPMAHSSEVGIDYVNTDFTIYVHRLPVDEWLGFELAGHSAHRGIAVGECWLHDVDGPIGTINLSAIAQMRKR